jgi:hypothetical protein
MAGVSHVAMRSIRGEPTSQPHQFAATIAVRVGNCRLLKNQNPLENRDNFRSSSPQLVVGRRPGNRAAILRSEIHGQPGAMAVPIAGVRFGRSPTRRRGDRRPPPREDPAQARRALAGGFDNRTTGSSKRSRCSLQPGIPSPITLCFLTAKSRRGYSGVCQRPVEARIMPDSYFSSVGSAFTEIG